MQTDRYLFLSILFLIGVAIVFSYSLSVFTILRYNYTEFHYLIREFAVGMLSIFIMWGLSQLDPDRYLNKIGFTIFFVSLILMSIMQFLPANYVTAAGGAKRWIRLPGFSLSPVEFFKVGFVYFLAWSFARKLDESKKSLKEELKLILPYVGLFLIAVYLIAILQNDLGQVVVLALTLAVMAFFAGTSAKLFMLTIIGAIIVATGAIATSTHRIIRIKTWWATIQNMVLSFFPPNIAKYLRVEDAPEPYQISHSLNAIKHGGLFGTGIGSGTFKLGFLSEVHTDFVLAGISEEIGAIGVIAITLIYLFIIFRIFKISNRSENKVYHLFALGVALLLAFSFLINALGITSVIPMKGIAVPFLSYGGSSMLAASIAIGMTLMISKKVNLK